MPYLPALSARSGIPVPVLESIISAGRRYAQRVVLYGSRARGTHRPGSDMDIAFYGDTRSFHAFEDAMDELPTLLKVDLHLIEKSTSPEFAQNIRKDGIVLMENAPERAGQFAAALDRMAEAAELYRQEPENAIIRDALIQRFEFTYELAWKALKDHMNEIGFPDVRSPRGAIQEAFAQGLITPAQESTWVDIIKARNLTTHMYDEAIVSEIAEQIVSRYLPSFRQTLELLMADLA